MTIALRRYFHIHEIGLAPFDESFLSFLMILGV